MLLAVMMFICVCPYCMCAEENVAAYGREHEIEATINNSHKGNLQNNYVSVQAYGRGHDRKTAMENALEEALRVKMGTMIMSREELNDDTLTEKVIQVSRGSIRDAEILSEERLNGEYVMHVRFRIDTKAIIETVTNYRKVSGGKFDVKRRPLIKNGFDIIDSFFRGIKLIEFIDAEISDRKIDIEKGELSVSVSLTFNRDKYLREFYSPLSDILDELLTAPEFDSKLSGEDDKIKYAAVIYLLRDKRTLKGWRLPLPLWEAMKNSAGIHYSDLLKTHKRLWLNLLLMNSEGHELSAERIPVNLPVTNILFFSVRNDSGIWSLTGSSVHDNVMLCAPFFGEYDDDRNFYSSIYSDKTDPLVKRFIFHLPGEILSEINSVASILNLEE